MFFVATVYRVLVFEESYLKDGHGVFDNKWFTIGVDDAQSPRDSHWLAYLPWAVANLLRSEK